MNHFLLLSYYPLEINTCLMLLILGTSISDILNNTQPIGHTPISNYKSLTYDQTPKYSKCIRLKVRQINSLKILIEYKNITIMNYDQYESEFYDHSLDPFTNYEEYLDSHITKEDLMYLGDIELARQLKEQGYHSKTEILTRQQFLTKKKAIEQAKLNLTKDKTKSLASTIPNRKSDPFLDLLAEREEKVLNGRWLTIIFLRVEIPGKKQEISGYIDYAHRLKTEDFRPIFEGKVKLLPKPTDLSYYNWKTGVCASNDSPNFKVDSGSGQSGLLFRNKRDRKVINVNPNIKLDENVTRKEVFSPDYTQIVLYDHETRKKNA